MRSVQSGWLGRVLARAERSESRADARTGRLRKPLATPWRLSALLGAALLALTPMVEAAIPAAAKAQVANEQRSVPDRLPEGLSDTDWHSVRAAYEAGRHAFQSVDSGWRARNPGQQWLTQFDGRGFLAEPDHGAWTWGLQLESYGFGTQQQRVGGEPAVTADGQRLTYAWDSTVHEWYVNDTRGLEHGFVVQQRPQGGADAQPLALTLAVRGALTPRIAQDNLGVQFQDGNGATVLNYAGLKVWDADGRALTASFEPGVGQSVRLLVDERGARYPVTIDPIAQQAYLKASNTGAGDQFGYSLAMSGDTLVVGAYLEDSNATGVNGDQASNSLSSSGAAYVFTRSAEVWTQQAYLKASNTGASDQFGYSLAMSGDTLVVGANGEDSNATGANGNQADNSAIQSGAAYVYTRSSAGVWTQQAYLKASNTGVGDAFGHSLAISGDTLVVGANGEDSNASGVNGDQTNNSAGSSGAAYVFTRNAGVWTQQAYLKASNTEAGDQFGQSLAMSGDTLVVGAFGEDSNASGVNGDQISNGASNSGAAYVFTRDAGVWTQQAYLKASNTGDGDNFGHSLAMSGDTLVVGARLEDSNATGLDGDQNNNSAFDSGAAYVYTRSSGVWAQQAYLKASNTGTSDFFGWSLAMSGDTLAVSAPTESSNATGVNGNQVDNSVGASGAAYVFARNDGIWTQQAYLKASNTAGFDIFGYSLAMSGDTLVVGAPQEDSFATGVNGNESDNNASDSGAAYVFKVLVADLTITKTDGSATAIPGTPVTYTLVASNAGPDPVAAATVTDTFPATLSACTWTCVGASGGTCTAAGSGNIGDTVSLPPGASVAYTATCTIAASATGTLVNTATIGAAVIDADSSNNTATDSDTLTPQADVSITLTDSPDPVSAGANLTYVATLTNDGPSDVQGANITSPLPAGTSFVSAAPSVGGSCNAASPVVCTWAGATAPAGVRSVSIVALVAANVANGTVLSATATAASTLAGNNLMFSGAGSVGIGTRAPAAPAALEVAFNYTGGVQTYTVPAGVYSLSVDAAGASGGNGLKHQGNIASYGGNGARVRATLAVTPGETLTLYVGGAGTQPVTNGPAAGAGYNGGGNANSNGARGGGGGGASDVRRSATAPSIALSQRLLVAAGGGGGSGGNSNNCCYAGDGGAGGAPNGATGGTLWDVEPPGTGATQSAGGSVGGSLGQGGDGAGSGWYGGAGGGGYYGGGGSSSLGAGGGGSAWVSPTGTTGVAMTAGYQAGNGFIVLTLNNTAMTSTTVVANADLSITLTDSPDPVIAGSNLTYVATLTNGGPSDAQGASIRLPLPAGTTFVSAAPSAGGSCNAASPVVCTWAGVTTLSDVRSVAIVALVAANVADGTVLSATATAVSTTTDPTLGNNSATDTSTVLGLPVLAINSVTAVEGDSGSSNLEFTVTRSTTSTALTVDYATADGSATAGSDYTTTTGTLNFSAGGAPTKTIQVPITGDNQVEGSESFTLTLSNPTGNAQIGAGSGTGTIQDDDTASIAIDNVSLAEGNSGTTAFTFTATLTGAVQDGFTVPVASASGTASAPSDFTAIAAGISLTFAGTPGETRTIAVLVDGDTVVEANETFTVTLGMPSNAAVAVTTASGTGTIENDDAASVAINNVSLAEGNSGATAFTFTATLTGAVQGGFTVPVSSATGTATAPSDYTAILAGTNLTFTGTSGETRSVTVQVTGDTVLEADETFTVMLGAPSNPAVDVTTASGTGTIQNDDAASISINNVSLAEGNSGPALFIFTATLTGAVQGGFTVAVSSADGSATAGSDYTAILAGTQLTFAGTMGETQTVTVEATGDTVLETDETFMVTLGTPSNTAVAVTTASGTGTIQNDDAASIAIAGVTRDEGNAGTTNFVFIATLTGEVQGGFTVPVTSTDGTATAPSDYAAIAAGTTLSFAGTAGEQQTVSVSVVGETLFEFDESFSVTLGTPSNAAVSVATASASGTIGNDDVAPSISVSSPSQNEGNAGNTPMNFVINLSTAAGRPISFTRATADGSATAADNDYLPLAAAAASIPAGTTLLSIPVQIVGDTTYEGDQSFSLVLSAVDGATPVTLTGTGTIIDDDQQPTTTTITSHTPSATVVGQGYSVAASVSAVRDSPLGTLSISDGSENCGPVALVPGKSPLSTASCILTSLSAGTKTLTATYTPASSAYAASTGTASHLVSPAATSISLTGPARSRINQPTQFDFALTITAPGGGTPTGTVTLASAASTCSVTLPTATPYCDLVFTALGARQVSASFTSSNGNHLGASSSGAGNASTLVYALSDLSITKTDGEETYQTGDLIVYTVQVRNAGPDAAAQVRVQDLIPAGLASVQWTCDASGGASCNPAGGSGNLDVMLASLPVGGLWNYTFYGTVNGAPGEIVNTATLTLPADTTVEDPNLANNSATDVSRLEGLFANGFEATLVNAAEGSVRLPTAALATVLDGVARQVFRLDDKRGDVARVYARLHLGAVEYALAQRSADGRWTLGPWQGHAVEPTLNWTAEYVADAWQVTHVELR